MVLPFIHDGWEGSYCSLWYGSWLFTACLIVRERCSDIWYWKLQILILRLEYLFDCFGVSCPLHRFGHGVCWKCLWWIVSFLYYSSWGQFLYLDFHDEWRYLECICVLRWKRYTKVHRSSEYSWVLHKYKETPLTECAFPFSSAILWSCAILSDR